MSLRALMLLLPVLLLIGCTNDGASHVVGHRNHSLSVLRQQAAPWDNKLAVSVVLANLPDCQRHFPLERPMAHNGFQVELFQSAQGPFILRAEDDWYVADTKACVLQRFDEPPPEPGRALGLFEDVKGEFVFTPYDEPEASGG